MAKGGKESLRLQILKAARKLLVKDGVQNVSMRKIAAVIGYTATSIYYHFKNKDELIHALIDEGHEIMVTQLNQIQEDLPADTDPVKRIEANMRGFVKFGLENPEYYEIMYMMHSQEVADLADERPGIAPKSVDLGIELYKKAYEAGLVRERDAEMTSASVAAMLHGYISMALLHRLDSRLDADKVLDDVIDCIMRGILLPN
ncbi:MAG: TetR/AcrR family transcriptional regulator [Acidobacteriota bacterium]|nr:TetR/AcrR family transcriptional regulator [Acidobacteriota bacterium]